MIIDKLPKKIAIFPLTNAIFFPKTILPLNIFETRYIQLVDDCMKNQKLFGMIQPKFKTNLKPEVYDVGCLGKVINFNETSDNRFIISLSGIIRFRIIKEINNNKLYREFNVDYSDFRGDLDIKNMEKKEYDEKNLLNKIKFLFKKKKYFIEFNKLEELNFDQFINTICMISPFSAGEKQKLIEAIKMEDKLKTLNEIVNFNLLDNIENKTIQ